MAYDLLSFFSSDFMMESFQCRQAHTQRHMHTEKWSGIILTVAKTMTNWTRHMDGV